MCLKLKSDGTSESSTRNQIFLGPEIRGNKTCANLVMQDLATAQLSNVCVEDFSGAKKTLYSSRFLACCKLTLILIEIMQDIILRDQAFSTMSKFKRKLAVCPH